MGKLQQQRFERERASVIHNSGVFDAQNRLDKCHICGMSFERGETLIKLECRHTMHAECATDQCLQETVPHCSVCGGRFVTFKRFNCHTINQYDGPGNHESHDLSPRASQGVASGSGMHTPNSNANSWYPAPNVEQPTGFYDGKTELKSGRPAALIDPGAWTSAAGEDNIKALASKAKSCGYSARNELMETPLKICGVGDCVQTCNFQSKISVAIPTETGDASISELETPIIGGSGKHLSIILGLKSMSARRTILEMEEGKEFLTFPGPGGYTLTASPGSIRIPLVRAMGGHLMALLDHYDKVPKATGVVDEKSVLHAVEQTPSPPNKGDLTYPSSN